MVNTAKEKSGQMICHSPLPQLKPQIALAAIFLLRPNLSNAQEVVPSVPVSEYRPVSMTDLPDLTLTETRKVDLNDDQKPEIVYHLLSGTVTHIQTDLNHDGKFDSLLLVDGSGEKHQEYLDFDFDGVFDWIDVYEDGERILAHADTNYDGESDVTFHYLHGQLVETNRR